MSEFAGDFIEKMINQVNEKKEEVIRQRCLELSIPEPNKNLSLRRFNPFSREVHQGYGELLYFDDGTTNGLFIVGFKEITTDISSGIGGVGFGANFNIVYVEPDWNRKKLTK